MNPEIALIHPYRTDDYYYLYDGLSNRIYRINDTTYDRIVKGDQQDIRYVCSVIRENGNCQQNQDVNENLPNSRKSINAPKSYTEIDQDLDSRMNQLILEITEKCPLRCQYCVYSGAYKYEREHSLRSMPVSIAEKAIDLFIDHSHDFVDMRTISFYGGEPLNEYDLIRHCVKYGLSKVNKESIHFSLTTNGFLLTREKFDFLVQNNIMLYVSLDGPRELHNRYRITVGGRNTFDRIDKNLKDLRIFNKDYYAEKVNFLCVISDYNELPQLCDFFDNYELTSGHMVVFSPIGNFDMSEAHTEKIQTTYNPEVLREIRAEYCKAVVNGQKSSGVTRPALDELVRRVHERKIGSQTENLYPNGMCIPGVRKLYVRADGVFYPCERVGDAFPIGSVNDGVDVTSVINLVNDYCQLCNEVCINCWASGLCTACFTHAREGTQMTLERKLDNCHSIRSEVHAALVMYSTIMEENPAALENHLY